MDPILQRFEEDIDARRFVLCYDSAHDMMTAVFYRPEDAITIEDEASGVYIDFDPVGRRFASMTILNFWSSFLPAHAPGKGVSLKFRLAMYLGLCFEALVSRLGFNLDRYWGGLLKGSIAREAMKNYRLDFAARQELYHPVLNPRLALTV